MATYDFIVVGAGSAGCAAAGRLASESASTVLLIEAGGPGSSLAVRAPMAATRQWDTALDWAYETEPEPGLRGRRLTLHSGRMLGGTSGMNAMVWVKGSNLDYDGWRLPGWSWADVAPVFARIEQGPMRVGRVPYPDELSGRFVAAARTAGTAARDDVSGPDLDGATISPVTIHKGERWTTASGYLNRQKNLTVLTKAEVLRVIIRDGRAVGVEYRRRGRLERVFADHEIVVSAGALGTPKLLQLSGVGPADHLRSVGVSVLVDSPRVGTGLTDHPHVWATWKPTPGFVGLSDMSNPKWLLQWLLRRRGKLANTGVEAVAHIRSAAELEACDFQLMIVAADALADLTSLKLRPGLSIGHSYWTPASRGSVQIRSSDPSVPPVVRLNLLTEPSDVDALKRGIERGRQIIATEPLAAMVDHETFPGRDSDLDAAIRESAITTFHPACSVAMGTDHDSALDERLRVRGVEGLRVADASALPRIPRANTNAPSIMVGERCADFLLAR